MTYRIETLIKVFFEQTAVSNGRRMSYSNVEILNYPLKSNS